MTGSRLLGSLAVPATIRGNSLVPRLFWRHFGRTVWRRAPGVLVEHELEYGVGRFLRPIGDMRDQTELIGPVGGHKYWVALVRYGPEWRETAGILVYA